MHFATPGLHTMTSPLKSKPGVAKLMKEGWFPGEDISVCIHPIDNQYRKKRRVECGQYIFPQRWMCGHMRSHKSLQRLSFLYIESCHCPVLIGHMNEPLINTAINFLGGNVPKCTGSSVPPHCPKQSAALLAKLTFWAEPHSGFHLIVIVIF